MQLTTLGVVTLGFEPPMAPGNIDPVSLNLKNKTKYFYFVKNIVFDIINKQFDFMGYKNKIE